MNNTNGEALDIARSYVNAIANKDVEMILSISAKDVVCTSPIGQTNGIEQFRAFHDGFEQAVVVYDAETHPVPHSIIAELIKVKDGKLVCTDVIYDASPFASYMATVQPH